MRPQYCAINAAPANRTNGALVNVALATGSIGRLGGGCIRLGEHQEGNSRPSDAHVGHPASPAAG
jgi:arsenite oxidase large subunit